MLLKKHYPFSGFLLGAIAYLVGLALSYQFNIESFYLHEWIFPLGCLGIIWVASTLVWGFNRVDALLEELKNSFDLPKSKFEETKCKFEKRVSNDKTALMWSIPIFGFVGYNLFAVLSGREEVFEKIPSAITSNISVNIPYSAFSFVLFCFCGYLIAEGAVVLLSGLSLLNDLTKSPVKLKILQKRRKLNIDKFLSFITVITICWFIGVSIIMVLLITLPNMVILLFLFTVTAVGLTFFFVPQILFHRSITLAKEKMLETIEADFSSKTGVPLAECNPQEVMLLCMLYEQVEKTNDWPIRTQLLAQVIFSAILPVLTAVIAQSIK